MFQALFEYFTAWKMSKYGVFSGPYFPVFSPNTGKYGPEKTLYLDTFHAANPIGDLWKKSHKIGSFKYAS